MRRLSGALVWWLMGCPATPDRAPRGGTAWGWGQPSPLTKKKTP